MGLTDIEGIGDTTAQRILDEFGSEEAFREAAEELQLDRIGQIEGLGGRRAVDIVLRTLGREPHDFLRTPRARHLYEDIQERMLEFANTDHARNRIRVRVPLQDRSRIRKLTLEAMDAAELVEGLAREAKPEGASRSDSEGGAVAEVAQRLRRVHHPRDPARAYYDGELAILVDTEEDYERLVESGVDRHAQVLTPQDATFNEGFDLIVYAYSQGRLDLEGADNVVTVTFTDDVSRLVPDAVVHRFRHNRDLLETLAELRTVLGDDHPLGESGAEACLEVLDRVGGSDVDFHDVEERLQEAVEDVNTRFREAMQGLSLEGDELLSMMGGEQPKQVSQLQTEILQEKRRELMDEFGEDFTGLFKGNFPLELDEERLQRKRREIVGRRKRNAHREKSQAAQELAGLEAKVEEEVRALLEFDHAFALGRFVRHYRLNPAGFGPGVDVEGALHLDLPRDGGGVPVDYHVGTEENGDRVVLLTGANSGGKTTLLETLGQITILAHMGLPVPAERAQVRHVEALYFFTQKRSMDAGAFETFLRDFVPIVTSPTRKLVLADELEAMTELEAAARIIGTFVEFLKETESLGVVVTHMAEEVSQFTSVRIDGIEAKGLDEDLNLIVDRTPRIGYRARSTPELILQRLAQTTKGKEQDVYRRVLETFDEDKLS